MHGPIDSVYRQIRRNRIVEIQFLTGEDAGMSILRSNPHLRSIEMAPTAVVAELETDDEGLATLMEEMLNAGVRMKSFNDRDPTLEDVFMTVTEGFGYLNATGIMWWCDSEKCWGHNSFATFDSKSNCQCRHSQLNIV